MVSTSKKTKHSSTDSLSHHSPDTHPPIHPFSHHRPHTQVLIHPFSHHRMSTNRRDECGDDIPITVVSGDQKWTFHCDEYQPLATTLFIPSGNLVGGRCFLNYNSVTMGNQLLDRTITTSFYGMIYDDIVYLGGIARPT